MPPHFRRRRRSGSVSGTRKASQISFSLSSTYHCGLPWLVMPAISPPLLGALVGRRSLSHRPKAPVSPGLKHHEVVESGGVANQILSLGGFIGIEGDDAPSS